MSLSPSHKDAQSPPTEYRLRRSRWDSKEMLKGLTRSAVSLPEEQLAEREGFFWNAMATEYDARNFNRHLSANARNLSPEFLAFKRAWSGDEWNHYVGFRYIYSMLYGRPEGEIAGLVEVALGDFDLIAEFLDDEFKLCLLLAYDEIATSKSYFSEFPLYRALGNPKFLNWFKKVTVDELYHFQNCMEIIRFRHGNRIPEIAETLDSFIKHDLRRNQYERTFVFDHYWYSESFLQSCKELIIAYFQKGLRGAKFATEVEMNGTSPFFNRYTYL